MELTKFTEEEVKKLLNEFNHSLVLSDIPLIFELNEADKKVVSPTTEENEILLDRPIWFGDYPIYPITLGIAEWLKIITEWFKNDKDMLGAAMIYVLTKKDIMEELEQIKRPNIFKMKLKLWLKKCSLTENQVNAILDLRYPQNQNQNGNESSDSDVVKYGPLICLLIKEYGQDIDYWLNAPIERLTVAINEFNNKQEAQAKAAGAQGGTYLPLPTPQNLAIAARTKVIKKIKDAWRLNT